MPPTPARYRALQWFADHDADPLSVLLAPKPSRRMINLMLQDGHLERRPVGQFGHARYLLTEEARRLLANSNKGFCQRSRKIHLR
jgi:hypothetical protein